MPPKKKRKVSLPGPDMPEKMGKKRRYLTENFGTLPDDVSALKNGHVLLQHILNNESWTETVKMLMEKFPVRFLTNHLQMLMNKAKKYMNLSRESEMKKYDVFCSEVYTLYQPVEDVQIPAAVESEDCQAESSDVYKEDLKKVKVELSEVEVLLQELLERQSSLLQRKENLEKIIQEQENAANAKFANQDWDKTDFPWSQELEMKLKNVFKLEKLRPMQLQTMNMTMAGKDCILIMPTGGGKSLCFQLPAVVSKGVTLVISPLISLMEDQLMALAAIGVESTTLNSSSTPAEVKAIQEAMTDPKSGLKLLYVTPEKLAKSKRFMNKLEKMYQVGRFSRLVIDEVHCCSQWGHDFRPDYKFLGIMKRQFPEVPILGLTATATVNVLEDVKKILSIPKCHLFRASFNRPNLYYQVRSKPAAQVDVMNEIQKLIQSKFHGESGIVYCFSKKDAEEVTSALQARGIRSGCYHANLSSQERSRIHKMWSTGQILVVVATIAFGMGIDKPNVRFVIHHSVSKSMENLYQESGRAGRDEQRSHCVVFYRLADVFRQSTMVFTEQTGLKCLYGILDYCLDWKSCRRAMIAKHFGETWESSQCNGMCDHCDPNSIYTSTTTDITYHCKNILTILKQASDTDQRVTALKLVDSLLGKGQASLKVKDMKVAAMSREKAEHIIGYMLLKSYLKEDFHFTAYTTISYILLGHKASLVLNGNHQVSCNFQIKALGVTKSPKSEKSPASTNMSSKSSTKTSKSPKSSSSCSVISPKYATNSSGTSTNGLNDSKSKNAKGDNPRLVTKQEIDKGEVTSSGGSKTHNSTIKKRKPVISDTDEEEDGLDFGELCTSPKKKHYKTAHIKGGNAALKSKSKGNNSNSSLSSGGEGVPICIEDSDSDFET